MKKQSDSGFWDWIVYLGGFTLVAGLCGVGWQPFALVCMVPVVMAGLEGLAWLTDFLNHGVSAPRAAAK